MEKYLTREEFSELTGLTFSTVKQRCCHKRIKYTKSLTGKYQIPISEVTDYFIRRNERRKRPNKRIYKREFQFIDTELKAYFLGFLYADGSISKVKYKNTFRYYCRISLHYQDKDILEKVKKEFSFFRLRGFDFSKYNKNNSYQFSLSHSDEYLFNDLLSHGVLLRKSYENKNNLKLPNIPKELMKHFIRGLFDGDGCIYIAKKRPNLRRCEIGMVSKNFIKEIQNWFEQNGCAPHRLRIRSEKRIQEMYVLEWLKTESILKMRSLLYTNANYFLERKKNKFDSLQIVDKTIRDVNCPICKENKLLSFGCRKSNKGNGFRYKCTKCNKRFTIYKSAQLKFGEFSESPAVDNTDPSMF